MQSTNPAAQPIASKIAAAPGLDTASADGVHVTTAARVLAGMHKEALVRYGPTGACWRMMSDEGPYLNGTDLAPFPLAFFSTGMVTSYMSEILALARQRGIQIEDIELVQDNRYGMEGSAFHGTMIGSALPVELGVRIQSPVPRGELLRLVQHAVAASPADALLRNVLASEFSLTKNDSRVPVTQVRATEAEPPAAPGPLFDNAAACAASEYAENCITKFEAAQTLHGVEGGAG